MGGRAGDFRPSPPAVQIPRGTTTVAVPQLAVTQHITALFNHTDQCTESLYSTTYYAHTALDCAWY
jgi:hypothetical protein